MAKTFEERKQMAGSLIGLYCKHTLTDRKYLIIADTRLLTKVLFITTPIICLYEDGTLLRYEPHELSEWIEPPPPPKKKVLVAPYYYKNTERIFLSDMCITKEKFNTLNFMKWCDQLAIEIEED